MVRDEPSFARPKATRPTRSVYARSSLPLGRSRSKGTWRAARPPSPSWGRGSLRRRRISSPLSSRGRSPRAAPWSSPGGRSGSTQQRIGARSQRAGGRGQSRRRAAIIAFRRSTPRSTARSPPGQGSRGLAVRRRRPRDSWKLPPPQRRPGRAGGRGRRRSGRGAVGVTLNAASWAQKLGRPLWAVPGPPWDPRFTGCRALIDGGARVVTSIDRLVEALALAHTQLTLPLPDPASGTSTPPARPVSPPQPPVPIPDATGRALFAACTAQPRHIDEIAENARICVSTALTRLLTQQLWRT